MTNRLNLPDVFIKALTDDNEHTFNEKVFYVTDLLRPYQEIILMREHHSEIEEDASDLIPSLLGTAFHELMEKNTDDSINKEYKLSVNVSNSILKGRCDGLDLKNQEIYDFKTTTTSSATKKETEEDWFHQGMMYAYMCWKQEGVIIRHLTFYAIMKDWSKLKSVNSSNYPPKPVKIWKYEIQDSDYDYIEKFIFDKVKSLEKVDYNNKCSDKDKWYTGDTYSVLKNIDSKRALKNFTNYEEAQKFREDNNCELVRLTKGQNLKCLYYCPVSKWCKQYKEEQNG